MSLQPCSVAGCPNLEDPRWGVHRDGEWLPACDGHGCIGGAECKCDELLLEVPVKEAPPPSVEDTLRAERDAARADLAALRADMDSTGGVPRAENANAWYWRTRWTAETRRADTNQNFRDLYEAERSACDAARAEVARLQGECERLEAIARFAWHLSTCRGRDLDEDGYGTGEKGRDCTCGYAAAIRRPEGEKP